MVFVHGWSVTNTNTYGRLPDRLRAEATSAGLDLVVKDIYLGKYISFHDEVRVPDISRAFQTAVDEQLASSLKNGRRFACITHSTGGPVIRDWSHRYYETVKGSGTCPMSHLIMLAPANFGSALAALGKSKVSRLKFWFGGVEPGQGVLDWLALGSRGSWDLNTDWIASSGKQIAKNGVFPFVLTGQSIDRAFYDHLNSYTGELGSDGVVRAAAANLNSNYIKLVQQKPQKTATSTAQKKKYRAPELVLGDYVESPASAFRIIKGKSHSGSKMGIMRSVKKSANDKKSAETVNAILRCIAVQSKPEYAKLTRELASETDSVQVLERVETDKRSFLSDKHFIHDRFSMVVCRVRDSEGHSVKDFDLILTAGPEGNPNHLPQGFFADRQRNGVNKDTVTFLFNYDLMVGSATIKDSSGNVIRQATTGAGMLGFRVNPRPDKGFVRYLPCEIKATSGLLAKALRPNCTTLIDIKLQRVVSKNVFRADKKSPGASSESFAKTKPGEEIV